MELTDAQRRIFEEPNYAVATTLRADGSPHSTVVWVELLDGQPSFNTAYPRAKPRHLERDPRVALTVLDREDPFRWLSVSGIAALTTDGANDQIDRLSQKYRGVTPYDGYNDDEQRVTVRIAPEHVTPYGLD